MSILKTLHSNWYSTSHIYELIVSIIKSNKTIATTAIFFSNMVTSNIHSSESHVIEEYLYTPTPASNKLISGIYISNRKIDVHMSSLQITKFTVFAYYSTSYIFKIFKSYEFTECDCYIKCTD